MRKLCFGLVALVSLSLLFLANFGSPHSISAAAQCNPGDGEDPCPPTDPDSRAQPVCSPIILDLNGSGFFLTNAANGVNYDIAGNGHPVQIAWTAAGADNAFLCLPGDDGKCDDGKRLFGNFTPQPPSRHRNGFAALAAYDQPSQGGNGDGVIDARDRIFASLRLWVDANHDGVTQPDELFTLPSKGITSISLTYRPSMRRDQYGNLFRYRSRVNPDQPGRDPELGRAAYDVFLVTTN